MTLSVSHDFLRGLLCVSMSRVVAITSHMFTPLVLPHWTHTYTNMLPLSPSLQSNYLSGDVVASGSAGSSACGGASPLSACAGAAGPGAVAGARRTRLAALRTRLPVRGPAAARGCGSSHEPPFIFPLLPPRHYAER